MQLHEAYELTEVFTAADATRLIQTAGWSLLSTVGTEGRVVYVLGKKKSKPQMKISPAASAQANEGLSR